jgi:hypothetical protein
MEIYKNEVNDGLAEKILASQFITIASAAEPCQKTLAQELKSQKAAASYDDADLYYVQSIMVTSNWNRNDDIFDAVEVWKARKSPEDKPTNLEHDESIIIGHITSNWPIDDNGKTLPDTLSDDEVPQKFHILTGSVIYRAFTDPDLMERSQKLIAEIEDGTKYVSMECYFKAFDYGLIDKSTGDYKVLARGEDTAYLTRHLRAYGGTGEHENYKIGRVLRNITFSGKGFVDKPANPESIIFTKENIDKIFDQKNDDLSESGVIPSTLTSTEKLTMSTDNLQQDVAEIKDSLSTVASTVEDAKASAAELKTLNLELEGKMSELQAEAEMVKDENLKVKKEKEEAKKDYVKSSEELEALKAAFAELEETLAGVQKNLAEKEKMEAEKKAKSDELEAELVSAHEKIAAFEAEKAEAARLVLVAARVSALVEAGVDEEQASATVEKFADLDDESFADMTALLAGVSSKKAEEDAEAAMPPALKEALEDKKKKEDKNKASEASEEAEEAQATEADIDSLEEAVAEETPDLTVGSTSEEDEQSSVRAELVEFVSARLNK